MTLTLSESSLYTWLLRTGLFSSGYSVDPVSHKVFCKLFFSWVPFGTMQCWRSYPDISPLSFIKCEVLQDHFVILVNRINQFAIKVSLSWSGWTFWVWIFYYLVMRVNKIWLRPLPKNVPAILGTELFQFHSSNVICCHPILWFWFSE